MDYNYISMFIVPLHTTFYIFRHGDTYHTKNKLPYEDMAISAPVIPEANKYLKKIGEYLNKKNIEYAVTSAFLRCMQSAETVGEQMRIKFFVNNRLNEYDPVYLPGESEENFKKRVDSFLSELIKKNFNSVAICTHGAVISLIKHRLINKTLDWNKLDFPPPGVLLIISKGKLTIKDFRI